MEAMAELHPDSKVAVEEGWELAAVCTSMVYIQIIPPMSC
jgi:hypothetical protein